MLETVSAKRDVVMITSSRFWQGGVGLWTRSRSTIQFLAKHTNLTIGFIGPIQPTDSQAINTLDYPLQFIWAGNNQSASPKHLTRRLRTLLKQRASADVHLIEPTENSFLLDALPPAVVTAVDTHDLISARTKGAVEHGANESFPLSADDEREILSRYDRVICIQQHEYQTVSRWLGKERVLLVPHPQSANPQKLSDTATRVGFTASEYHPNVHGLRRFIDSIWPAFAGRGVTLHVFGRIAAKLKDLSQPFVYVHGFQKDLSECYRNIDVAINPVVYGAGLKIKTIEAMAHGIPLVTTAEGASGLQHLGGKAFLLARSDAEFIAHIETLLHDVDRRRRLAKAALAYVKNNLTEEQCFGPLLGFINNC